MPRSTSLSLQDSPGTASQSRAAQLLASLPVAGGSALWLADRMIQSAAGRCGVRWSTGFAALDAELPGGGWPAAGLTELLLAAPGSGELRLLASALAHPLAAAAPMLWIAPPFMPYAPALQALGLALDRLVVVTPGSLADAAWAAEQALRAGVCSAVLWWQQEVRAPALATVLRRLHLAAQQGACPLFALRPVDASAQASPAPLRLSLAPAAQGRLAVTVFKRRGPAMAAPLLLALPNPVRRAVRRVLQGGAVDAGSAGGLSTQELDHAVVRVAPERLAA